MPPYTTTPLLRARNLTVVLAGDTGDMRVLDAIAFDLSEGEIVDVTGPSGSGKSTFLRAIARLIPNASGELTLDGDAAATVPAADWRARVTLLPQKAAVVAGSVRDNLELPWRFKVRSRASIPDEGDLRHALDSLGLEEVALDREAARLSVGQQARLAFARVWLASPRVLLLDEADAALDDESSARLTAAVAHFAAEGGRLAEGSRPGGVVRVRHRADDGLAARRLRLAGGRLEEVPR